MKGMVSYRFTGESIENVGALCAPVLEVLKEKGHEVYCNFFDSRLQPGTDNHKNFGPQDYIFRAFGHINDQEFILVLLKHDDKSEGMLLEVGYAMAKGIPVVVAKKASVTKTYLDKVATESFEWEDQEELLEKLKEFDFTRLQAMTF